MHAVLSLSLQSEMRLTLARHQLLAHQCLAGLVVAAQAIIPLSVIVSGGLVLIAELSIGGFDSAVSVLVVQEGLLHRAHCCFQAQSSSQSETRGAFVSAAVVSATMVATQDAASNHHSLVLSVDKELSLVA